MTTSTSESDIQLDPVALLNERFTAGIARAFPDAAGRADALIAPSKKATMGDFQCNAAMALGKMVGQKPRDVAEAIVAAVDIGDIAQPLDASSIAGPGFINIRLRSDALAGLLGELGRPDLGLSPAAEPQTIVVDLCGVNLAKQMHVGHIRAIVIGDSIARTFERLGHKVIRQNHVGDWGLPIAMVVDYLHRERKAGRLDLDTLSLDDLDVIYKAMKKRTGAGRTGLQIAQKWDLGPKVIAELEAEVADADEALAEAKSTLIALQAGEEWAVALWQRISDITMGACIAACQRMHTRITLEASAGESSYRDELAPMVEDLIKRDVAEEDGGALVVRGEGKDPPALVRKGDGGFLYATTDIAAIRRRVQEFGASRVIYCVDVRQALHFRQVFAAAHKAGYATTPDGVEASLEHAAFGTILGTDNKPFKTRSGESVKLQDLLDEAHDRARAAADRSDHVSDADREKTAETVAMTALKFADLSTDRLRDYVFDFDRILAFEGDTGPYLLNALVRIKSIFREAQQRGVDAGWADAEVRVEHEAEKQLAMALLRYPSVVRAVAEHLEPHRLCQQLLEIATRFSSFYQVCKVLGAEDEATRASRLRLCELTARVLEDGLDVLGLPTLDRM
ncbi:MAG: arginine--tRNA ligase [Phycisphaerales bacterium]|nr:arginine--tRNA ligase [Phycisphaerales bacterium]